MKKLLILLFALTLLTAACTVGVPQPDDTVNDIQDSSDIPSAIAEDVPADEWLLEAARMTKAIEDYEENRDEPPLTVEVTETSITIRCQDDLLFNSGRYELLPKGMEILDFIAGELIMPAWDTGLVSEVRIEAHEARINENSFEVTYTCMNPSINRAISVYIHLTEHITDNYDIPAENISPSSQGAIRPLDRIDKESDSDWLQRNCRIEFVLTRSP